MLNCKEIGRKPPSFGDASIVATELLNSGYEFDQGSVIFNRFRYDTLTAGLWGNVSVTELNFPFLCCRSVISYKTDQKPLFSNDIVANAGSIVCVRRISGVPILNILNIFFCCVQRP